MKKVSQAVLMPLFVSGMQLFFKFIFNVEFPGIGISCAAIALGQIFPYIFFDNLVIQKCFALKNTNTPLSQALISNYTFEIKKTDGEIKFLKDITIFIFLIILSLFIVTLGLYYKPEYYMWHNYFGISCVLISICYIIFA